MKDSIRTILSVLLGLCTLPLLMAVAVSGKEWAISAATFGIVFATQVAFIGSIWFVLWAYKKISEI